MDLKIDFIENFRKSKILWAIQEEVDRVSSDRTMRFHSKKKHTEYQVKWDDDGSKIFKPNGINRGNVVAMKNDKNEIFVGQVLKFQYKQSGSKPLTTIQKRYSYHSLIFDVNKIVEIQLAPIFQMNYYNESLIEIHSMAYIDSVNYLCHIRSSEIDFGYKCFKNSETRISVYLESQKRRIE